MKISPVGAGLIHTEVQTGRCDLTELLVAVLRTRLKIHVFFFCFSEQTAIIFVFMINWLVFIIETVSVYWVVRTAYFNIIQGNLSLKGSYILRIYMWVSIQVYRLKYGKIIYSDFGDSRQWLRIS
jgi:hypothetical protein